MSKAPAGTWVCIYCGKDLDTKKLLNEHYKSDEHLQDNIKYYENLGMKYDVNKRVAYGFIRNLVCFCKFCNKNFIAPSEKGFHEKYSCNLNPNRLKVIGHKQSDESKLKISNKMKTVKSNEWNTKEFRALNSAKQYLGRFDGNSFDIYYSIDSQKCKAKVGISKDIENRYRCFDQTSNGDYIIIRHFSDIKEAVLCEALITLNFFDNDSEWYDVSKLDEIIAFVKSYNYENELNTEFASKLFI